MPSMILVGDVNLMNVQNAGVPFARIGDELRSADLVFANLECCLYQPPGGHAVEHEGFFADPGIAGEALGNAGIAVVGLANNVNYGAAAIGGSIAQLDRLGIAHTGAGADLAAARAPAVVGCGGRRIGILQRSSVYWPTNHEASARAGGIAVIPGHTAYQVPAHKARPELPPMNRPGHPPIIVTWADRKYLAAFTEDIAALRREADIVVASCHWGLGEEVLDYMHEIAHAAIEAGADIVIGHGPHYSLPVEVSPRQADLLWARQLLVPYRAWRAPPRRLDRHDGAGRCGAGRGQRGALPFRAPQRGERDGRLRARRGGCDARPHHRAQRPARRKPHRRGRLGAV